MKDSGVLHAWLPWERWALQRQGFAGETGLTSATCRRVRYHEHDSNTWDPYGRIAALFLLSFSLCACARSGFGSFAEDQDDFLPSANVDTDIGLPDHTGTMLQVSAPEMNPTGGTYGSDQYVTIASSTSGAIILFTVDGSSPDQNYYMAAI